MDTDDKIAIGFAGILLLSLAFLMFIAIFTSHIGSTNKGQHTGYITAVEQQGWIWKTWRAYVKTDTSSSQEDVYCVMDEDLVSELKDKATKRELVNVNYSTPFVVWKWECEGEPSIIRSIN